MEVKVWIALIYFRGIDQYSVQLLMLGLKVCLTNCYSYHSVSSALG